MAAGYQSFQTTKPCLGFVFIFTNLEQKNHICKQLLDMNIFNIQIWQDERCYRKVTQIKTRCIGIFLPNLVTGHYISEKMIDTPSLAEDIFERLAGERFNSYLISRQQKSLQTYPLHIMTTIHFH